jgi:hypothetical protein
MNTAGRKQKHAPRSKPTFLPRLALTESARALLDGETGLEATLRRIGGNLATMHRDLWILRTHVLALESDISPQRVFASTKK